MSLAKHTISPVKSCNFHFKSIDQIRSDQACHFLTHNDAEYVIHAFVSSYTDSDNSFLYGWPDYQSQVITEHSF